MVALLREFPSVKATFNLVPSLLVQLEAFAREEARDRHLELGLKPAAALSDDERAFCVEQFFHAHRPRMIDPYPRYRELLERRASTGRRPQRARRRRRSSPSTTCATCRCGTSSSGSTRITTSATSASAPSSPRDGASPKTTRRRCAPSSWSCCGKVIPEYAAAAAARAGGAVDLAVLPPDPAAAVRHRRLPAHAPALPHAARAVPPSRGRRRAARTRASRCTSACSAAGRPGCGRRRDPSRTQMVPLAAQAGFTWMATDEEILAKTRRHARSRATADGHVDQPELLYRPYRVGRDGASVACGFRDHALSDLIGFSYASWSADGAADDFVQRLVDGRPPVQRRAPAGERPPSSSSSTARTPGSTTTGRAARSCGRSTAGSHPIPSSGP